MRKPVLIVCLSLALAFVLWRVGHLGHRSSEVAPVESTSVPVALDEVAHVDTGAPHGAAREAIQVDPGVAPTDVPMTGAPGGYGGLAQDPEGAPVGGVCVTSADTTLAVSGPDGRFVVSAAGERLITMDIRASKEGWTLLAVQLPLRRADGTWTDARFVLAPSATLRVRVVDADGALFSRETIRAQVSPAEPHGASDSTYQIFQPPEVSAETGADGVATLDGVAARVRLRVSARGVEHELWDTSDEPRLAPRESAAVDVTLRAVVLEASETRTARIVLGRRHSLHGRVVEPDGTASPGASITVLALDEEAGRGRATVGATDANADGHFALELLARRPLRRALVVAQGRIGEQPPRSMFSGRRLPDPLHVTWEVIELPDQGGLERELVLHLTPMAKVSGRVVSAAGEPVKNAKVVLHPRDASPLDGTTLAGGLPSFQLTQRDVSTDDATFRFGGVPPGLYDVEATSSEHAIAWARGVTAGAEDVVVQFGEPRLATVHIEVTCHEPLKQLVVLQARLQPNPGVADRVPRLASLTEVTGPFGWPDAALGLWYGTQGYSGPLGTAMFGSWLIKEPTTTRQLAPGLVWLGAKGRTERGALCFPSGTGLVRIEEGEHVVRIALTLAGSVRGRITGAPRDALLAVALATYDGRLVPLDGRRGELEAVVDVGAGGAFLMHQVPAGEFELRVGHPSELLRSDGSPGGALVRRRVTVAASETLELEIEL
jgi:hypothetical protein